MTQSERRLASVSEMTAERLAELRRIAEAATPGPWRISDDGPADRFVIASADREHIAETTQGGSFTNEDLANAHHISTFDPPTVLALLNEIERLRRERKVLAEVLRHAGLIERLPGLGCATRTKRT